MSTSVVPCELALQTIAVSASVCGVDEPREQITSKCIGHDGPRFHSVIEVTKNKFNILHLCIPGGPVADRLIGGKQ